MNIFLSLISLILFFLLYYFYKKLRAFKMRCYVNSELKPWDYSLFISYLMLIIILLVSSVLFILKEFLN